MMIKGRKTMMVSDFTENRDYSLEEIHSLLASRKCTGFLMVMQYQIQGQQCFGSGLTLWGEEHAPFARNGKLVVKTNFRRIDIRNVAGPGDPDELIPVEVEINPNDPLLFISFRELTIRCNQCMKVFYSEDDLELLPDTPEDPLGEILYYKGCPTCKTDAYLMDLDPLEMDIT